MTEISTAAQEAQGNIIEDVAECGDFFGQLN